MDLAEQIKAFLQKETSPASARWISTRINFEQAKVSRELRKLVKAGSVKVQLRHEFDFEYSGKLSRNIACKRRRNYYWMDLPPPKKKKKRAKVKTA